MPCCSQAEALNINQVLQKCKYPSIPLNEGCMYKEKHLKLTCAFTGMIASRVWTQKMKSVIACWFCSGASCDQVLEAVIIYRGCDTPESDFAA